MDRLAPEKRSWLMSRIRSKNTKPEIVVRSLAHRLGFRFRLHRRDLPGTPDLAFIARKKAIFVHGCFWHGHKCKRSGSPKTNKKYWEAKISENKRRDARNRRRLAALGWRSLVVWECELSDRSKVSEAVRRFLD